MFDFFHFWNEVPLFKFPTQLIMCIYLSVILADPPRKRIDSIQLNGSPRLVGLNIEKFNDIKYLKKKKQMWCRKTSLKFKRNCKKELQIHYQFLFQ